MRNFWPTKNHGTAFAPKQWLHQNEATEMELKNVMHKLVQKLHLPVLGRKLPRFMWGSIRPTMVICKTSGLPTAMVLCWHQSNRYIKRNQRVWRAEKCKALVGAETSLSCAWSQTTPFHGGKYRAENGNVRHFGPPKSHGTAFAPNQWLHQKESTGMESSKM